MNKDEALAEKILSMSETTGRAGCTYGDTEYDSLSAVYGYNTALSNVKQLVKKHLRENTPVLAKDKPEYIVCAAIWYNDGKQRVHQPDNIMEGIVACGLRHSNCFSILHELFPSCEYKTHTMQGFLTSRNRFVSRENAANIARKSGQIQNDSNGALIS